MKNKIQDLRDVLFDQLSALKNADPMDLQKEISRTVAVVSLATTIIDSSRAETEFLKMANEFQQVPTLGTGFISDGDIEKLT